jgi:hypothetical protein
MNNFHLVTAEKLAAQIICELEKRGCWKGKIIYQNQSAYCMMQPVCTLSTYPVLRQH